LTRQLPFPRDPDAVDAALDALLFSRDCDVTHVVEMPGAVERERLRRRQKLLLASKGIPPSYWDNREVRELEAYFWDLVEMLNPEEQA
jgi:hypothetical protein